MSETDRQLHDLYSQYQASKLKLEHLTHGSFLSRTFQRLASHRNPKDEEWALRGIGYQISELLRSRPGTYHLSTIMYTTQSTGEGFAYGFDYNLGDDVFHTDYWSYDRWGILVQKHPPSFNPEIEVLKEDNRGLTLLHLPEGIKIAAGPLHFENDSLPWKTLIDEKAFAIEFAREHGYRVDLKSLEKEGPVKKYPDRFFWWQPVLPDRPSSIAIDFDDIKPYHLGLNLENAPVLNNTIIVKDD